MRHAPRAEKVRPSGARRVLHPTLSPTGYRATLVERHGGEHGHRMGRLDELKPSLGLLPDDGYTVCMLVDPADERLCLKHPAAGIPILFRFDCGWYGELSYRLNSDRSIAILREPWDRAIGAVSRDPDWWPPRGDFGVKLTEVPQKLHDIASGLSGGWYAAVDNRVDETTLYVDDQFFRCSGGLAFHQVGGVPIWLQDPVDVVCPDCGEPMPFLLSLGSDTQVGWLFGDCGRLYAFYCERCAAITSVPQCG